MDEKDFKKHLQDLAHGHHHPEEHDWGPDVQVSTTGGAAPARKKKAAAKKAATKKRVATKTKR